MYSQFVMSTANTLNLRLESEVQGEDRENFQSVAGGSEAQAPTSVCLCSLKLDGAVLGG